MCREIDAHNVKLHTLLSGATKMTPKITAALAESSRLRSECQSVMLRHFFQVSQTMPPEQGQRYLSWVADNKAGKGVYHEGYCPMVKASWLQKETDIKNPYMGKAMLICGTLKN
jgi:hypothetical protein